MIESLFQQTNYVATKEMLDATTLRHEAIAANLGNLETPNYKRIDLAPNFKQDFAKALLSKNVGSISNLNPTLVQDLTAISSNLDGNSVDLEEELVHLNENALAAKLEMQMISGTLSRLRTAITGRV